MRDDVSSREDANTSEMSRYLSVQATQVEAASNFAAAPMEDVIECLIGIMMKLETIRTELSGADDDARVARDGILVLCNKAIENLQFSDELTQRLEHVSRSLGDLNAHVSLFGSNDVRWDEIEEHMRVRYSTEAERNIHAQGYGAGDSKE